MSKCMMSNSRRVLHVLAICHITEPAAGSSLGPHSLPCGCFLFVCGWACTLVCSLNFPPLCLLAGTNGQVCGGILWECYPSDCIRVDDQIKGASFHISLHGEQVNKQITPKEAWNMNAHTHASTDTAVWAHLLLWRSELIPAWNRKPHAY